MNDILRQTLLLGCYDDMSSKTKTVAVKRREEQSDQILQTLQKQLSPEQYQLVSQLHASYCTCSALQRDEALLYGFRLAVKLLTESIHG